MKRALFVVSVTICLCLILFVGVASANATFDRVYNQMRADYPEGMTWTNDNSAGQSWSSWGCWAYANIFGERLFGSIPARDWGGYHTDRSRIVVGDIISTDYFSGSTRIYMHTMVVVGVNGDTLTLAEGNYLGKIKYGRTIGRYENNYLVYHAPNYDDVMIDNKDPYGYLDESSGGKGTIFVRGWAKDDDASGQSLSIHVYVGGPAGSGASCYVITANSSRPDVGGNYGYNNTITVTERGSQPIYLYAINVPSGNNPCIGEATVTISEPTYTVTYDANGGTVSQTSKTVTYGSTYGTLETPSRTNYAFAGWYTTASGGTQVTSNTTVTTASDHTLYAHWTGNSYTLTYDANGGTVNPTSKTVTYGSTYGMLETPTRTGYTFEGWYTEDDGGTRVTSTSTVDIAANHTIYAHWTAIIYMITFDPKGGTVNPTTKTVSYNSVYGTLPMPTRPGYTFDGWFTSADEGTKITSSTVLTENADQTIYAHWSPMGELTLPRAITTIDEESFMSDNHISHVVIPASCTTIGSKAFANCKNLISVRILGKSTTFESDTFDGSVNVVIYCYSGSRAQRLSSADGIEYHLIGVASDWVSTDDVPQGAEVTDRKWTYTLREYAENSSASYTGWTKYDSKRTSWTSWSEWQDSEITSSTDREVRTHEIVTGYNMISYCVSGPNGRSYQPSPTYSVRLQHGPYWWSKAELDAARVFSAGSYFDYASNVAGYVLDGTGYCKWDGSDTGGYVPMFIQDTTKGTQWSYRDAIYMYYYYRDLSEESATDPSGQENVSNVQEWVKYIY